MTTINFEIERLEGRGITAKVINTKRLYANYRDFAEASGYSDAAVEPWTAEDSARDVRAEGLIGKSVKVLAKGKHETSNDTIYVVENNGERFLLGKDSLEIIDKGDGNMTKLNLDGMSHVEMIGLIEELVKRIKTDSFSEGYESGYEQAKTDIHRFQVNPFKLGECKMETPQQARDRIVEQAKADVKKENAKRLAKQADETIYYYTDRIDYVVNRDKRTVVALFYSEANGVITRGIAKCAPGDCFNVHIGKAIALRRALGLEVPVEYTSTPQPTEVRVGDKIRLKLRSRFLNGNIETVRGFYRENKPLTLESPGHIYEDQYEIIDDSREVVTQ